MGVAAGEGGGRGQQELSVQEGKRLVGWTGPNNMTGISLVVACDSYLHHYFCASSTSQSKDKRNSEELWRAQCEFSTVRCKERYMRIISH